MAAREAVNPQRLRDQGGAALRAANSRAAAKCVLRFRLAPAQRLAGEPVRRTFERDLRRCAARRRTRFTRRSTPERCPPSSATSCARLRGAALVEAVLPLRREGLAARRSERCRRRRRSARAVAQSRLAASLQRRRHLDAGQVGVPVVRGVGSGVSHDPDGADRSAISPRSSSCSFCASGTCTRAAQMPAYEWNLRDVNPPVHAWACWRVYKISGAARPARHAVPRARLSEAAASISPGG